MQGFCESYEIWPPPTLPLFGLLALAKIRFCASKIEVCELKKLSLSRGGISGPLS